MTTMDRLIPRSATLKRLHVRQFLLYLNPENLSGGAIAILAWETTTGLRNRLSENIAGPSELTKNSPLDAIRLLVYYNDEGGVESKISIPGVENGKWKKEDSYNDNEMALLLSLIEEALPLLERQVYEFAFAVYEALESFDSDPSLTDPELAQFMSLEQPQRYVMLKAISTPPSPPISLIRP